MYYLLFILTFPISAIIDKIIGEDGGTYLSKSQMKKLFQQYEKDKMLQPGERKMLSAALELKTKIIGEVMTPMSKIFMLDINQTLDEALKRTIYEQGYSRIPIYEDTPENIIGILMSRDLILANIDDNLTTL
jgi:metal transporter CNNM